MKNTKENIAAKALELFNERGIEYVGMRELATALDTRIGNITYYFPTKDELVYYLATAFAGLNAKTLETIEEAGIGGFLGRLQQMFHNQQQYKCILLSSVHLIEHNPQMADDYKAIRAKRTSSHERSLRDLIAGGHLKMDEEQLQTILSSINLISRFWMAESIISGVKRSALKRQIPRYLRIVANLLKEYATRDGLNAINMFLGALPK